MSYYILQNDETKGPYTLGQLRAMWNSGAITTDTLHSQEGYSEWLPLSAIVQELEPPPAPPPVPPTTPQYFRQPAPPPKKKGVGFVGGCLLVVVGFIVIVVIMSVVVDTPSSSSSGSGASSSPKAAVTASVSLTYDAVRITNLDSFDWPRTSIYINGIMGGYIYRLASVPAGKTVTIPLREFATRGGERFEPERRKPKELVVHPDGYDGRQFLY